MEQKARPHATLVACESLSGGVGDMRLVYDKTHVQGGVL